MRLHALLRPFDLSGGTARERTSTRHSPHSTHRASDERRRRVAARQRHQARGRRRLRGRLDARPLREALRRGWHVSRTARPSIATAFIAVVRALNQRGWRWRRTPSATRRSTWCSTPTKRRTASDRSPGRRWTIEHAFIGRPDHLPRMKALDVAISAQNHLYLAGPSLVKYWGRDARVSDDAGAAVSRCRAARVVRAPMPRWCRIRRSGRLSLHFARHADRRRDGSRSADHAAKKRCGSPRSTMRA